MHCMQCKTNFFDTSDTDVTHPSYIVEQSATLQVSLKLLPWSMQTQCLLEIGEWQVMMMDWHKWKHDTDIDLFIHNALIDRTINLFKLKLVICLKWTCWAISIECCMLSEVDSVFWSWAICNVFECLGTGAFQHWDEWGLICLSWTSTCIYIRQLRSRLLSQINNLTRLSLHKINVIIYLSFRTVSAIKLCVCVCVFAGRAAILFFCFANVVWLAAVC